MLTDADTQAPALLVFGSGKGRGELSQPIKVGEALYVVPVPPAGASPSLLSAYSVRATASVTGHCPACGARRHVGRKPHLLRLTFHHEHDCPAGDNAINAALHAEGFAS